MAKLTELSRVCSQIQETDHGMIALNIMLQAQSFLEYLEQVGAFELGATDDSYTRYKGTTVLKGRAFNTVGDADRYVKPSDAVDAIVPMQLKAVYDKIKKDITYIKDQKLGMGDASIKYEMELAERVEQFAKELVLELLKGDGTKFLGFLSILDGTEVQDSGETRVYDARDALNLGSPPAALDLSNAEHQEAFLEMIEDQLDDMEGNVAMWMPRSLRIRIGTIAHKQRFLGESRTLFGKKVKTYDDVPMYKFDNTIMAMNEPDSADVGTYCGSILLLAPQPGQLAIRSNSGIQWDEEKNQEGDTIMESIEFRGEIKAKNVKRFKRIKGITLKTPA
jgi:hypothetical protein